MLGALNARQISRQQTLKESGFVQILRARTAAATFAEQMRLHGTTVLVVDEDADNLELLALCLKEEGARVLQASSIARALATSAGQPLDVVVTDMELPDGDGVDLLRQLRDREGWGSLPAIAVSGYAQEQWRSRASSSEFNRHALKPFAMDTLITLILELNRGGLNDQGAI